MVRYSYIAFYGQSEWNTASNYSLAFQADFFFTSSSFKVFAPSAQLFKHNSRFYAWGRSTERPKTTIFLGGSDGFPPPPPPPPHEFF